MKEFKGTKGPWENVGGWVDSSGKDSKIICAIGSVSMQSEEMQEANANLIAAAPDMLVALQSLLVAVENIGGEHVTRLDILEAQAALAYAAIDKALGETK